MGELRVEIPEELREEMEELPNVDWKLVVRRTLKRELEEILELKRIIFKSKLTEEDVEELSDKINESLAKRFIWSSEKAFKYQSRIQIFSTPELLKLLGFFR
ncbi:MAG: hypothetical protein KAV25_07490 [Methanophagales archaeon]|nr:hypothetical protein [Methanophagales archaeon]